VLSNCRIVLKTKLFFQDVHSTFFIKKRRKVWIHSHYRTKMEKEGKHKAQITGQKNNLPRPSKPIPTKPARAHLCASSKICGASDTGWSATLS
jgi:hypothetical protein